MSQQELEDKMTVLLGGRAAEMILGDDVSTGAADDLAKATDIARGIVMRFGMDEQLGPVAWDTEQGHSCRAAGGVLAAAAIFRPDGARDRPGGARACEAALARAVGILQDNRDALDEGATALLAHETLGGDELPKVKPVRVAAE